MQTANTDSSIRRPITPGNALEWIRRPLLYANRHCLCCTRGTVETHRSPPPCAVPLALSAPAFPLSAAAYNADAPVSVPWRGVQRVANVYQRQLLRTDCTDKGDTCARASMSLYASSIGVPFSLFFFSLCLCLCSAPPPTPPTDVTPYTAMASDLQLSSTYCWAGSTSSNL
jgi:hypothetical protein